MNATDLKAALDAGDTLRRLLETERADSAELRLTIVALKIDRGNLEARVRDLRKALDGLDGQEIAALRAENTPLQEEREILLWAFRQAKVGLVRAEALMRKPLPDGADEMRGVLDWLDGHDGLALVLEKHPYAPGGTSAPASDNRPFCHLCSAHYGDAGGRCDEGKPAASPHRSTAAAAAARAKLPEVRPGAICGECGGSGDVEMAGEENTCPRCNGRGVEGRGEVSP